MITAFPPAPFLRREFLPEQALYGEAGLQTFPWQLSPCPIPLSPAQILQIEQLGPVLLQFMQACDTLYHDSLSGQQDGWIARLLDQGKPEALVRFSQMRRLKGQIPRVLRPDLLITENGFTLCEIDAVPGGLGFTAALNHAYRKSGFSVLESPETLPVAFLQMLRASLPHLPEPVIAVVLSDEAADYKAEMNWLVHEIQAFYPDIYLVHPREVDWVRDSLVLTTPTGKEKKIDLIYRFFELFDLPNIPKIELIQYAVKKGSVLCTPPFKPQLEEKSLLALLHHPVLIPYWQEKLGLDRFTFLQSLVPPSWILDPSPLPPQSVIPNLSLGGKALQSFEALKQATQKQRRLVVKPSGFSPLAWGSRGVTIGHDVPQTAWQTALDQAFAAFEQTPYLLQVFHQSTLMDLSRLDALPDANTIHPQTTPFKGRVRLCPYYFVSGESPHTVTLGGILATACPSNKKIIHGMQDAILAPLTHQQLL